MKGPRAACSTQERVKDFLILLTLKSRPPNLGNSDVVLRSTDFPNMKFNQFLMAPYFGPGLLPHAQKLWIDELAVGAKRIGPLELER